MKVREVIKLVEADGWRLIRIRGDHRQYRHPTKSGKVTIPGKMSSTVKPGALSSILRQAGLKEGAS